MTDTTEHHEALGEKVVAAVQFSRSIIEAVWDGKISDPEVAASIQTTAQELGLTVVREPTPDERADPNWWGHGTIDPGQLIECFDPNFAAVVEHLDQAVESVDA